MRKTSMTKVAAAAMAAQVSADCTSRLSAFEENIGKQVTVRLIRAANAAAFHTHQPIQSVTNRICVNKKKHHRHSMMSMPMVTFFFIIR